MQPELDLVVIDPDKIEYSFPCFKVTQPIGDMYVAAIPFKTLIRISYFDVRRVLQDERDVERYLGIQRPLIDKRVRALEDYVNYADASFPTSVILSVDQNYAEFNQKTGMMHVRNTLRGEKKPSTAISRIAKVLDGQHRIAGLSSFRGETFDLTVTIFVGADVADEATIFSTVNLEQTKVHKSLVYDLFSLARSRSPQKTCHNIAVALDRDEEGPLFQRMKRLGFATEGRVFEPITQATFVEALLPYLSENPKADRDLLLRGKSPSKVYGDELLKLPFRNLFIDGKDLDIAKILHNYFEAVSTRWPTAWNSRGRGMMLNRTNGFRGLMRFLRYAYLDVGAPGDIATKDQFLNKVLARIQIEDEEFTTENFPPGSSGEAKLVRVLRRKEKV